MHFSAEITVCQKTVASVRSVVTAGYILRWYHPHNYTRIPTTNGGRRQTQVPRALEHHWVVKVCFANDWKRRISLPQKIHCCVSFFQLGSNCQHSTTPWLVSRPCSHPSRAALTAHKTWEALWMFPKIFGKHRGVTNRETPNYGPERRNFQSNVFFFQENEETPAVFCTKHFHFRAACAFCSGRYKQDVDTGWTAGAPSAPEKVVAAVMSCDIARYCMIFCTMCCVPVHIS